MRELRRHPITSLLNESTGAAIALPTNLLNFANAVTPLLSTTGGGDVAGRYIQLWGFFTGAAGTTPNMNARCRGTFAPFLPSGADIPLSMADESYVECSGVEEDDTAFVDGPSLNYVQEGNVIASVTFRGASLVAATDIPLPPFFRIRLADSVVFTAGTLDKIVALVYG